MDELSEKSSKLSQSEDGANEGESSSSPAIAAESSEPVVSSAEKEEPALCSELETSKDINVDLVTDVSDKSRRVKKQKSSVGSDKAHMVNSKDEDLLSLPKKRPRTTALSRAYRQQKKHMNSTRENGQTETVNTPAVTCEDESVGSYQPAEIKQPITSVEEERVPKPDAADEKKIEETSDVTRSRYGRIRKKRPISPVAAEIPFIKDVKIPSKEASESIPLPTTPSAPQDKSIACDWQVGDIVWARLSGYPWWPGLIGEDPLLKIYTKIHSLGREKHFRMYHVQFLGSAVLRGWLAAKSLMPFEGKEKYEEEKKKAYDSAPSKARVKAKIMSAFEVKPSHLAAWLESVEEAEEALPLNREERQQKHGVDYFTDSSEDERRLSKSRNSSSRGRQNQRRVSGSTLGKRERRLSKTSEASSDKDQSLGGGNDEVVVESKPRRQSKVTKKRVSGPIDTGRELSAQQASRTDSGDNANSDEDFELKASPKKSKTVSQPYRPKVVKGNFDLFLQKHKEEVKKEHPDQPDESIENFLRKQWEIMTDAQRARYRSHFGAHPEATKPKSPKSPSNRSPSKSPRKETPKSASKVTKVENSKAGPSQRTEARRNKASTTGSKPAGNHVLPNKTAREGKLSVDSPVNESDVQDTPDVEDFTVDILSSPSTSDVLTDASILEGVVQTPSSTSSQRNNGDVRVERICLICEKPSELANDLVKCEGMCSAVFHMNCIGMSMLPSDGFKCEECTTGNRSCFSCKEKATDLRRCTVAHCGRFYHESCLQKNNLSRIEGKSVVCPLHVCKSCAASNPKHPWANKGKLFRCIRCPTAYHATESCMGAGSAILSQGTMVCPRHYKMNQKHLNVNWCFLCSVGGSLLCCESCPAAFHVECLEIDPPEGSYFCADCVLGQQPKFGDIVWVKLGCYRWWPAEIQNPKSVPDNIQSISHKIGEFPVFFFGSHDYYWTNRSRVYQYQEGDRGTKDGASKGLAKVFEAALHEAAEAYKALKEVRESREAQEQERINQRPPPYRQIKNNKPVGRVQLYTSDHLEQNPCECDPHAVAPCSSDTECLNRMLMVECDPAVCAAGEHCHNQRFQKRQYVATLPIKTEGKGWGLKTLADIKKGDFVIEYVGEVIDEDECRQRMAKMHEQQCTDFYFLTIDKDRIIDAGPKGNPARYMNHSCQPNCETQKWTVNGDTRVGLFAISDISMGAELTFNYNLDCLGNEKSQCCCGAANCSGYIGDRPKVANSSSLEKKSREASFKKRKKRRTVRYDKREHEDECFRCGEGGELVMCDKKSCSKAYHLTCLSLSKPPHGRWECPWHHCDVCGRLSVLLCAQCPNSFCQDHHEDLISVKVGGILLCYDHGSQPSEDAAKLLQLRTIAFQNMCTSSWNGNLNSTDGEPSIATPDDVSGGDLAEASSLKRRRGRSTKDLLQSCENECSTQFKEESADEAMLKCNRGKPHKSSLMNEVPLHVNGNSSADTSTPNILAAGSSEPTTESGKHSSPEKINTRASNKDCSSVLPVNGTASPLKQNKEMSKSETPSPASNGEDGTDSELMSEQTNVLMKPNRRPSETKSQSAKNSTRSPAQRYSHGVRRQRKTSVNGSVSTTNVRNRKSVEHTRRQTRQRDVMVVEERMAVLNGNLTVDSVQPEVVTIKDESMDEATAIITVENLSGVGALDLKPYVQKYKLENGELSLEECEDSEIEMLEDRGRS